MKKSVWRSVKPGEFKNIKFEKPVGSIVCECGTTHFIYPNMFPELKRLRRGKVAIKVKK